VSRYILALDQGTTSSRSIIFDNEGREVASASQEFDQIFPRPGWVEHDPEQIWSSQLGTARMALEKARLTASDVAAIGITNQRETTVIWDRDNGVPIHNAIVWQDRRTTPLCDELRRDRHQEEFRSRTGLLIDPYFSATKIRWLLDNVPDARGRAMAGRLAFGTVDSWLVWKLTAGRDHLTDTTNASRTMLFNLDGSKWDDDLLRTLDIPPSLLPRVVPSSGIHTHSDAGLFGVSIPIAGIAGDQQAALFGQACFEPGEAKNTYGTGSFALLHTGAQRPNSTSGLLATAAASSDGNPAYALEGSIFVTGSAVQWLRDGLGIIASADEIEPLAASVSDSGGVVVVPAYTGLGAPHWDPHARGTILGITRGTSRAHIARATLEGITLQVCDVIEVMESDAGTALRELRVDGGAAHNDLLLQIQADLLGNPVVRPTYLEATARGAAYLAGLASGVWSTTEELRANWQVDRRFEPKLDEPSRNFIRARWQEAVKRSLGWAAPD
jgi:glycerol kinase